MAKTAKLKKSSKPPSLHSRASKRVQSPPSRSLDTATGPQPSVLSTHHGAGITKRKIKGKARSRQQRLRQEKGMERAEVVRDVRAKKVERSLGRGRVGKERGAAWEDLNSKIDGRGRRKKVEDKTEKKGSWEDLSMAESGLKADEAIDAKMEDGHGVEREKLEEEIIGLRAVVIEPGEEEIL